MKKSEIRNKIGLRIKELRVQHNLTQEKFALMTGINRSYLADIEKGHRNFGFDTLERIVEGFGISYSEFFEEPNQSNPQSLRECGASSTSNVHEQATPLRMRASATNPLDILYVVQILLYKKVRRTLCQHRWLPEEWTTTRRNVGRRCSRKLGLLPRKPSTLCTTDHQRARRHVSSPRRAGNSTS